MQRRNSHIRTQKRTRKTNKTVLIVGEGDAEVAFLTHLKHLFNARDSGISCTIRNAHGKGPERILKLPKRLAGPIQYDHLAAFLDNDIPLPNDAWIKAHAHDVEALVSEHCIEFFLLRLLGESPPNETKACKRMMKQSGMNLLNSACYEARFPKSVLEQQRDRFPTLRRLIEILSGARLRP